MGRPGRRRQPSGIRSAISGRLWGEYLQLSFQERLQAYRGSDFVSAAGTYGGENGGGGPAFPSVSGRDL